MRSATKLAALLALCLTLGLLAGCGSGEEGSSPGGAAGTATEEVPPQVIVEAASAGFDAAEVYAEASRGVVTIRSIFDGGGGEGSGFVLNDSGEIVTNAHVITDEGGGNRRPADEVFVEFTDRNVVPAEIVGFDPFVDVALVKVDPSSVELKPLELGADNELSVGQPVAAIGSPFGEQQSLSVGVISAIDRSVRSLTQFQIEGAIQTDASINPGNSGGPLLDAAARVIGINQQIQTGTGVDDGVGFAVPISSIRRSVSQLQADGNAEYAYIGVSSQALYPQLAEKLDLDTEFGGLLATIVAGGPAEKAGLEGGDEELRFQGGRYSVGGDVILAIDGREVVDPADLSQLIATYRPGDEVTLTVLRDGDRDEVEVTLGKRPDAAVGG